MGGTTQIRALIAVDPQNAFCAGGGLAVADGEKVMVVLNKAAGSVRAEGGLLVLTQDWHPSNHKSFFTQHEGKKPFEVIDLNGLPQVLWPEHAIQGTADAAFHADLDFVAEAKVFQKGLDPEVDSYSGFEDNGGRHDTGLDAYLKANGVTSLDIAGLATDYCVKYTVLSAIKRGYKVRVLLDGCRGVAPETAASAVEEMRAAGAEIVNLG